MKMVIKKDGKKVSPVIRATLAHFFAEKFAKGFAEIQERISIDNTFYAEALADIKRSAEQAGTSVDTDAFWVEMLTLFVGNSVHEGMRFEVVTDNRYYLRASAMFFDQIYTFEYT